MEEQYYLYRFDRTVKRVVHYKLFHPQGFKNIALARDYLVAQGFDAYHCVVFRQPAGEPASELEMA